MISINNEIYVIHRIHPTYTAAHTLPGLYTILANHNLYDSTILNYSRSQTYAATITLSISINTAPELIVQLKSIIAKFLKKNNKVWKDSFYFGISTINLLDHTINIGMNAYLKNIYWYERKEYMDQEVYLYLYIKETLEKLNIRYSLPPQQMRFSNNKLFN